MATSQTNSTDPKPQKLLTDGSASSLPPSPPAVVQATNPMRQLMELPKAEMEHLAEEFGLDPTRYKSRQELATAIHDRRHMIAGLDREAMLDVIRWGRRPLAVNATREQIAQEISRIGLMRFEGLSHRGLVVLARLRGIADATEAEPVPKLVKKLKKQEGFWARMNRKRRSWIAGMVANMLGEQGPADGADYKFLPPAAAGTRPQEPSIRDQIEESGLFGGIAARVKKTADSYINQKLDEIESRIDRKLDEIDRRLAEWRDKEVANRIRILKITLWASVIVGLVSLIYSWIVVSFGSRDTPAPPPAKQPPAATQPVE